MVGLMRYPAYESRELTGTILLRDQELMVKWKQAADGDGILARTINGVNYSVVRDPALAAEIEQMYGASLNSFAYDDAANTVEPLSVAQSSDDKSSLEKVRYQSGPTGADRDDGGNT